MGSNDKELHSMEEERQTGNEGDSLGEKAHKRFAEGQIYQIRVKGHLDDSWSEWFEGLNVTHEKDGATVLTGPITDQPALYGLLIKIRDLGLTLLSVSRSEIEERPQR
jgi:hypothetical protein